MTWSSSDSTIVEVNQEGEISALKSGTATITVALKGKQSIYATTIVTVKSKKITGIHLPKEIQLVVGDTYTIPYTVSPSDADNSPSMFTWFELFNYTNVLEVNGQGVIKANKAGTIVVRAYLEDNSDIYSETTVVVKDKEISLDEVKKVGDSTTLQKYLNQKYNTLYTPLGDWKPVVKANKKGDNWMEIKVKWGSVNGPHPGDLKVISPADELKKYGRVLTTEERNETKKLLRDYMKKVAADTIYAFPTYFVEGSFSSDGYRYPNLQVGYWSTTFLSWTNLTNVQERNDKAHWNPKYDDYNFVLDQEITGFSFINPQDGKRYTSKDSLFPVVNLKKGETFKLPLEITPQQDISDLTLEDMGFRSTTSKNIVSMDGSGIVTALNVGVSNLTIYQSKSSGGLFIEFRVTE